MATTISNRAIGAKLTRVAFDSSEDHLGRAVAVDGSNSFADLSYTLHEFVEAVAILNTSGATLYYTPDGGTAGTGNFPVPDGASVTIYGNRGKLANVRLYLAVSGTIGLIQQVTQQTTPTTTTTTTA
jgi:hypothetical protein